MQIGWIVNIMTVITLSCREIRAVLWNWSKSSYYKNHLKINVRLIFYENRPQLCSIEGITFQNLIVHAHVQMIQTIPPQALSRP